MYWYNLARSFCNYFVLLVHFWKIIAHTLASLEKLGKSDLARLVINHHNKFDTVLNNINSELLDSKNKFTKFESDLEISRNVSNKLVDQVMGLEWNCCEHDSTLGGNVEKYLETLK